MASIVTAGTIESADLSGVMGAFGAIKRASAFPQTTRIAGDTKPQISPTARLQNAITAIADAAVRLTQDTTWQMTKASSSEQSTVDAQSDGTARPATYDIAVKQLASGQITSSAAFSSLSTVIGLGTISIESGSWNSSQSTFATNPNWPKANITIGPGDNSLERIRDKINAAASGVIAVVLSDATGTRLVLKSTSTGSANGFKVSVDPADSSAPDPRQSLSALGFDPSKLDAPEGMSLAQAAQNATLTINGELKEADSNVVRTGIDGLTLQLKNFTEKPLTVRVDADTSKAEQAIADIAQAYNDIRNQLQEPLPLDAELTATAQSVIKALSSMLRQQASWSDVGLSMTSQGQMKLNSDRLAQSLSTQLDSVREQISGAKSDRSLGFIPQLMKGVRLEEEMGNRALPTGLPAQETIDAGTSFRQRLLDQYRGNTIAASSPPIATNSE